MNTAVVVRNVIVNYILGRGLLNMQIQNNEDEDFKKAGGLRHELETFDMDNTD